MLGVDEPDAATAAVRATFEDSAADAGSAERRRTVAGRVVLAARHGQARRSSCSATATGDLQLFCKRATSRAPSFALLEEVDLGDIVGASGHVGTTRKGELSVFVER